MTLGFPGANDPKYRISGDPQQLRTGIAHYNRQGYEMIVGKMTPLIEELISRVAH